MRLQAAASSERHTGARAERETCNWVSAWGQTRSESGCLDAGCSSTQARHAIVARGQVAASNLSVGSTRTTGRHVMQVLQKLGGGAARQRSDRTSVDFEDALERLCIAKVQQSRRQQQRG